jgi:hypothetical protein
LNPIEEGEDEIESDNNTAVDAPTPKCVSVRKKPAIDRFGTMASVGADIKDGILGLGDLVRQALAPKSQIRNETEILEVLKLQANEMKRTNDILKSNHVQLVDSQDALLKTMILLIQKQ